MSDEALFVGDRFYRSQFQNGLSSYLIFQQGGVTYADPLFPGGTPYSSIDGGYTIRSASAALASTGGRILVKNGTYTVSTAQNIGGNYVCIPLYSNVYLMGESGSAILKLDSIANLPQTVNMIGNANFANGGGPDTNIQVSNLQLDGNKANRGTTPGNSDTLLYFDCSSGF